MNNCKAWFYTVLKYLRRAINKLNPIERRKKKQILVLSRRVKEAICVDDDIKVVVLQVGRGRISLGVMAPDAVEIKRGEVLSKH